MAELFAIFIGIFILIDVNLHLCDIDILIITAHANDIQSLFEIFVNEQYSVLILTDEGVLYSV